MPQTEIDTSIYPKSLRMLHHDDGEREWWEWKKGDKAVAIQRLPCRKYGWTLYFINGVDIKSHPGAFLTDSIDPCINVLKGLGFKVKLANQ